ncbi:uncharacterized protein LOC116661335 [Camelus ferus]|uniref:Uncharacterized protein LOC116661335 n=1 Tax=Camelus ferus TaxID=419612 RepID=A0A8B8SIH0_CAMFR|nr:uncharacterized protein LOC116661335 [Camelus ferus]
MPGLLLPPPPASCLCLRLAFFFFPFRAHRVNRVGVWAAVRWPGGPCEEGEWVGRLADPHPDVSLLSLPPGEPLVGQETSRVRGEVGGGGAQGLQGQTCLIIRASPVPPAYTHKEDPLPPCSSGSPAGQQLSISWAQGESSFLPGLERRGRVDRPHLSCPALQEGRASVSSPVLEGTGLADLSGHVLATSVTPAHHPFSTGRGAEEQLWQIGTLIPCLQICTRICGLLCEKLKKDHLLSGYLRKAWEPKTHLLSTQEMAV